MNRLGKGIAVLIFLIFMTHLSVLAADNASFRTGPQKNKGKKWRIGYYEGGEYAFYQYNLVAMVQGLMDLGWIKKAKIPEQRGDQTKVFWDWLSTHTKSRYIQFVKDAHYSYFWNSDLREKTANELIGRLTETKDIDLVIAAGTRAGQDLANNKHKTPTIVISASDPIGSGIIQSIENSGHDHIHARVDPFRYERQIQVFYDSIGFKTLGIAYEDNDRGRTHTSFQKVKIASEQIGFKMIPCSIIDEYPDVGVSERSILKCFDYFVNKKADAIYVTAQNGVNSNSISDLVEIANSNGIPTFSQTGSENVKYGFLMSTSSSDFKQVGLFYAKTAANIFNGAKPRELDQLFEAPPEIAINLKTAKLIGYDPPVDVLGAADELFEDIEKP
jgi:ABC-type uncharacterized transport system substrate-binding protein